MNPLVKTCLSCAVIAMLEDPDMLQCGNCGNIYWGGQLIYTPDRYLLVRHG